MVLLGIGACKGGVMESPVLTHETLLALAASAGEPLTLKELLSWRKAGLLPRPQRLSKRLGPGSGFVYPPETASRVLALCHLRARFRAHPSALAVGLWVEGHAVPLPILHRALQRLLDSLWLQFQQEQEDPLWSVLEGVQSVLPLLRRVKAPRQRTQVVSFSKLFTSTGAGQEGLQTAALDEKTRNRLLFDLLMRCIKDLQAPVVQLRKDRFGQLGQALADLKRLVLEGAFSLDRLARVWTTVTPAQLEQAKGDFQGCLKLWKRMAHALEQVVGPAALRQGSVRTWRETPWFQGWILLILVQLRLLGCEHFLEALDALGQPADGQASRHPAIAGSLC